MTQIANLVHQRSVTTGIGAFQLYSINGRQSFYDAFGLTDEDSVYYFIANNSAAEWEVGTGHMTDGTTLVRDTVINSSNSDNFVNFSGGTKDVMNALPANAQGQNTGPTPTRTYISLASPELSDTDGNGRIFIALTTPAALAFPLPPVADVTPWLNFSIKCNGAVNGGAPVTLTPFGSDKIEDGDDLVMDLPYGEITIFTDGTQWLAE